MNEDYINILHLIEDNYNCFGIEHNLQNFRMNNLLHLFQ